MTNEDLKASTDAELETLESRIREELYSRKCPEFMPGHQSCDMGQKPHVDHGYSHYNPAGRKVRVTWHVCDNNDDCELHP